VSNTAKRYSTKLDKLAKGREAIEMAWCEQHSRFDESAKPACRDEWVRYQLEQLLDKFEHMASHPTRKSAFVLSKLFPKAPQDVRTNVLRFFSGELTLGIEEYAGFVECYSKIHSCMQESAGLCAEAYSRAGVICISARSASGLPLGRCLVWFDGKVRRAPKAYGPKGQALLDFLDAVGCIAKTLPKAFVSDVRESVQDAGSPLIVTTEQAPTLTVAEYFDTRPGVYVHSNNAGWSSVWGKIVISGGYFTYYQSEAHRVESLAFGAARKAVVRYLADSSASGVVPSRDVATSIARAAAQEAVRRMVTHRSVAMGQPNYVRRPIVRHAVDFTPYQDSVYHSNAQPSRLKA